MPFAEEYGQDQQQQGPPPPVEFSQGDEKNFNQLNNADATLDEQIGDGTVSMEDGQKLRQAISQLKTPLAQKKQAWKAQQIQQAQQQVHQDAAQAQGMQHANKMYDAKGFGDTVGTFTDPLSGLTNHFFQHKPGEWTQMQFPEPTQEGQAPESFPLEPSVVNSAGTPDRPDDPGTPEAKTETPSTGTPPFDESAVPGQTGDAATPSGDAGASPDKPSFDPALMKPGVPAPLSTPKKNEDGTHTLDIWNGQNHEQVKFDPQGKIVERTHFDRDGNPVKVAAPAQEGAISEAVMRFHRQAAIKTIGPPPAPPPNGFRNVHEQVAFNKATQEWTRAVDSQARHLNDEYAKRKTAQESLAGHSAESQRKEQVTAAAKDKQEQARKDKAAELERFAKERAAKTDLFMKTYNDAARHLKVAGQPAPSHETILAETKKRLAAHDEHLGVDSKEGDKPAAKPAGPSAPPAEALAKPSEVAHTKKVAELAEKAKNYLVQGGTTFAGMQLPSFATQKASAQLGDVRRFLSSIDSRGDGMTVGERLHYEQLLRKTGNKKLMQDLWPGKWVDNAGPSGDGHGS